MSRIDFNSYRIIHVAGMLSILIASFAPALTHAQAPPDDAEYVAKTIANPTVPVDELALMLKPLTKDELVVEAEAWQAVLKKKVKEISSAELAVKRKNREIESSKQTQKAVEQAQKATEKAEKAQQKAAESVDQKSQEQAAEAARDAEEALAKAEQAAEAAQATEEESDADEETSAAEETAKQRALEKEAEKTGATAGANAPAPEAAATAQTPTVKAEQISDAEGAKQTAAALKETADGKVDEKVAVLDLVTELRDERVAIVDRMNTVLAELKKKGGDPTEMEAYVKAVSGINVDVSDSLALWSTVKGWLVSPEGGVRWGENIIKFSMIAAAFWVLSLLVGKATERGLRMSKNLSGLMRQFLGKMTRRIVLVVGVIVALTALEVNIAPLLAVIGAAGFVIGFALQDTLGNFASGIMILLYRPFDVNDVVDVAGVSGKVVSLNLVSITVTTFDNKVVVVPNNSVWNNVITNSTGSRQRRVDLVFGIGYDDDIAAAQEVMESILKNHDLVLKDPEPVIRLNELGDSSVNFVCRPWVRTEDYWTVYWDVTRAVKEQFDARGISIPFPQRDVHVYNSAASSGDPAASKSIVTEPSAPKPETAVTGAAKYED